MSDTIEVIFKGKDEFTNVVKGIGGAVGGIGKTLATGLAVGATAAVGLGAAVVGVGAKLTVLGSDAAETSSLIQASLGSATTRYTSELKLFANQANRSFYELQQGTSTIIAMTKSMGASNDEAADFGITFGKVASDLGSFFNQSDSQVLLDIQSALSGSSETMQKYGINVKEGTLKQMALNQGLIETAAETLPDLVRAQLVQQAIMEQGKDAMGDAIRTSGGWANSLRGLKAMITDTATEMGSKLLPVLAPLLELITSLAKQALPYVVAAFDSLLPKITNVIDRIKAFVANLRNGVNPIDAFITAIKGLVPDFVINAIVYFRDTIIPKLIDGFNFAENIIKTKVIPTITAFAVVVKNNLIRGVELANEAFLYFRGTILPVLVEGFNLLENVIQTKVLPMFEIIKQRVNLIIGIFQGLYAMFQNGASFTEILSTGVAAIGLAFGLSSEKAQGLAAGIKMVIGKVQEFAAPIIEWIQNNVKLQDVLTGLAAILTGVVISSIASTVIAFAPFIAIGLAAVGIAMLIRQHWDEIKPVALALKDAVTGLITAFKSGATPTEALSNFVKEVALAFGVTEEKGEALRVKVATVIEKIIEIKDKIVEFLAPIVEWIKNTVTLNDVLTAAALILGGIVLAAVVGIVQAIGPVILVVAAVIAGVVLLRKAWEFLVPAIDKVKEAFKSPAFQAFKDGFLLPFTLAFEGLKWMIWGVVEAIGALTLGLIDIKIPDVLMPGSPTPFENGLKGIREQMGALTHGEVPQLNAGLQGLHNVSTKSQTVNQTTNIYTSRVDTRGESRNATRYALGGI